MPKTLPSPEAQFLLRGIIPVLAVLAILLAGWWSPWSPVALQRPADTLAGGDDALALQEYITLSQGHTWTDVQQEASWRAILLASGALGHTQEAIDLGRAHLAEWPRSPHRAKIYAQLATLYAQNLRDPLRAGEAWMAAAQETENPQWWLSAGEAFSRAQQPALADAALQRAAADPRLAWDASMALGHLSLSDDPSQAYIYYTAALRAAQTMEQGSTRTSMARLGIATSLERLERREDALAEVEEAISESESGDEDLSILRRHQRLKQDL